MTKFMKGFKKIKGKIWISEEKIIEELKEAKHEVDAVPEKFESKRDKRDSEFFDSGYDSSIECIADALGINEEI